MIEEMFDEVEITLNGTPLSYITETWGEPVLTWRYPFGSWELTWTMEVPPNFRHPDLVRGARVVAWIGTTPIWRGGATELDFESGTFTATGSAREAETAIALGFGVLTTTPSVAVNWGIVRGALSWSGLHSLPSTPIAASEETVSYNYVADLLNAWATQAAVNWWVNPQGYVGYGASPTTPRMFINAGAGILGLADQDYITDLYGRYTPGGGVVAPIEAHGNTQNVGRSERGVDLTGRGPMTMAQAQDVMDGILAKTKGRTGWTNGIEIAYGQICNDGGIPIALSEVGRATGSGLMVRLQELFDERGIATYTDVVIAEARWRADEGLMTLNPVGLAARDLAAIAEEAGGVLL